MAPIAPTSTQDIFESGVGVINDYNRSILDLAKFYKRNDSDHHN